MPEYAGRGDARRSLALLWGRSEAPKRGPKQGLDLATIVRVAIELADTEGLEGVSMRRVAERLGKSAMALYTYVPGKGELLDLMLDTVLGEPTAELPDDDWRSAMEIVSRDAWAMFERHPWMLQVSGGRTTLGPHEFDAFERVVKPFVDAGLSAKDTARVIGVIDSYVRGAAKAVADARAAEKATGVSDEAWWEARAPLLDEFMGAEAADRWPSLTWLEVNGAFEPALADDETTPYLVQESLANFEFGLQRLLDGIEAYVNATASP